MRSVASSFCWLCDITSPGIYCTGRGHRMHSVLAPVLAFFSLPRVSFNSAYIPSVIFHSSGFVFPRSTLHAWFLVLGSLRLVFSARCSTYFFDFRRNRLLICSSGVSIEPPMETFKSKHRPSSADDCVTSFHYRGQHRPYFIGSCTSGGEYMTA